MKLHLLIFSLLAVCVVSKKGVNVSPKQSSKETKKNGSSKKGLRKKERQASGSDDKCLNLEVNFAFGGAQTGTTNRVLECLGGLLRSCEGVVAQRGYLEEAGLILPGVQQQVDFALQVLDDEHKNKDLFMLLAASESKFVVFVSFDCFLFRDKAIGELLLINATYSLIVANDFLGPYPGWNPSITPPEYGDAFPPELERFKQLTAAGSVENLKKALDRIYEEFDVKYILLGNTFAPCSTPTCDKLSWVDQKIPGFSTGLKLYSAVWTEQFDRGMRRAAAEFQEENPEAVVIFVDILAKFQELLASGEFVTDISCKDAFYSGPDTPGPDANGFYNCENSAWTDGVHPTSAMWQRVVDETILPAIDQAVPQGIKKDLRRLIAFGDSLADLGSFKDTIARADEAWGASFHSPPATGPAAQNGRGLVEFIEEALEMESSVPFIQRSSLDTNAPLRVCASN